MGPPCSLPGHMYSSPGHPLSQHAGRRPYCHAGVRREKRDILGEKNVLGGGGEGRNTRGGGERTGYPKGSAYESMNECNEVMHERVHNEVMPLNQRVSMSIYYALKEAWSYPVNCPYYPPHTGTCLVSTTVVESRVRSEEEARGRSLLLLPFSACCPLGTGPQIRGGTSSYNNNDDTADPSPPHTQPRQASTRQE